MSFTAKVKDELSRVQPLCEGCSRSQLAALCRIDGTLSGRGGGHWSLQIATEAGTVARAVIILMKAVYDLRPHLTSRKSVLHKTSNYLLEIPAQPALDHALVDMGILDAEGALEQGIPRHLVDNECCAAAYLRGAFMAGGFVSDPRGDFHFELVSQFEGLAQALVDLLAEHDINARFSPRRNSYTVYMKNAEDILAFMAFVGAHSSALEIESIRVVKSVRNDVNRRVNAELANQGRSSSAALDQIRLIERVEQEISSTDIPPALREFMDLRRRFPDLSLRELGEHSDPPLSKSAVYHRLRRLEELVGPAQEG